MRPADAIESGDASGIFFSFLSFSSSRLMAWAA